MSWTEKLRSAAPFTQPAHASISPKGLPMDRPKRRKAAGFCVMRNPRAPVEKPPRARLPTGRAKIAKLSAAFSLQLCRRIVFGQLLRRYFSDPPLARASCVQESRQVVDASGPVRVRLNRPLEYSESADLRVITSNSPNRTGEGNDLPFFYQPEEIHADRAAHGVEMDGSLHGRCRPGNGPGGTGRGPQGLYFRDQSRRDCCQGEERTGRHAGAYLSRAGDDQGGCGSVQGRISIRERSG